MTQSNRIQHGQSPSELAEAKVTLCGPADLADALPYLMGFHPTDSAVLVALHGERGRFGGRVRLGLPEEPEHWPDVADQLTDCLFRNSARHGAPPDAVLVFLCQDPREGERSSEVMERLRPLAQQLRLACGRREVPVVEALCVSAGRWWSYTSAEPAGSPAQAGALPPPGSTAMAVTATYLGLPEPTSLRDLESRLKPSAARHRDHEIALDAASAELVPRMLADRDSGDAIRKRTLALAHAALDRFRSAPALGDPARGDRRDDRLLGDDEAASIILGLQDKEARDRVAEWMEPAQADPALRLWRALARRCTGPYAEHAAAPLALAAWVAWSSGDEAEARAALGLALDLDGHYTFARLLHHAVNAGIDPEVLRRSLRRERRTRVVEAAATARRGPAGAAGRGPGRRSLGDRRARTRR
jgi:hypothetical protein